MKQSNRMIKNRLKRAVETAVPDALPYVLKNIEKKGVFKMNTNNSVYTAQKEATIQKKNCRLAGGLWLSYLSQQH